MLDLRLKILIAIVIWTCASSNVVAAECAVKAANADNLPKAIVSCLAVIEAENVALKSKVNELEKLVGDASSAPGRFESIPVGAVIAFLGTENKPCPSKTWSLYNKAKGRVIIGAGQPDDSALLVGTIDETGGKPEHHHELIPSAVTFVQEGGGVGVSKHGQAGIRGNWNYPPFVALYYCRKN